MTLHSTQHPDLSPQDAYQLSHGCALLLPCLLVLAPDGLYLLSDVVDLYLPLIL